MAGDRVLPPSERPHGPARRRRLVWSAALVAGAVLGGPVMVPSYGDDSDPTARSGSLVDRYERAVAEARAAGSPDGTGGTGGQPLAADGHAHDHSDPSTKNAVSRSDASDPEAQDPTTNAEKLAGITAVAKQRSEPQPELVPIAKRPGRSDVPEDRYAMAGGCYGIQAGSGKWVARSADGFAATAGRRGKAEPFHFQATDLGKYLLFGSTADFLAQDSTPLLGGEAAVSATAPSESADWTVRRAGSAYTFTLQSSGDSLAVGDGGALVLAETPARFRLRTTTGCAEWPEVDVSLSGRTFRGVSDIQETRGYVDAHTHGMAFEFLGGKAHCGRPWHPYGVTYALKDCDDHTHTNGYGAVLETALSGRPGHDPVGWPTFKDWPAPDSLTHEGTYYKWIERSWRGGLRLFVNLLVENNQLCQLYPLKQNSCDDMDSIRLQAKDMRAFERYIDAQHGGPGEGWYRIVTNPFQARKVVNQGKLAVVMGIETSIPFNCTMKADIPQCDKESIDKSLAEVHKMGVRQMELVNKFDNALSGVAGDSGEVGALVNGANFLETGSFWAMEHCEPASEGAHDKEQYSAPEIDRSQQDAIFGAIYQIFGPQRVAPVYDSPAHCNKRGLTDLGRHLIRRMAERGMVFDPDHMSVSGRNAALDLLEDIDYPGVISSHSWSTPDAYPRIYRLGGTITPYGGDSEGFVDKWRQHLAWADPRYYFGIGYGADMNGLGAQGDPRGSDVPNPVTYPFEALGGVTVKKQVSGERVYDINVDGVAHYGLYPDWIEDLTKVAGDQGDEIFADMSRGTEAYLQMWERAVGVSNDACRDPRALKPASTIRGLPKGASAKKVLRVAGQPHERLDDTFSYCARSASGRTTEVEVVFDGADRVSRIR
jgi:microsomal dipeptidase-like Zn-dependent dipeptidase